MTKQDAIANAEHWLTNAEQAFDYSGQKTLNAVQLAFGYIALAETKIKLELTEGVVPAESDRT